MNNVLSLRDYINNKDSLGDDVKAKTFCRLMKKVMEKKKTGRRPAFSYKCN